MLGLPHGVQLLHSILTLSAMMAAATAFQKSACSLEARGGSSAAGKVLLQDTNWEDIHSLIVLGVPTLV